MKINYGNLFQWIVFSPILLPILFFIGIINSFEKIFTIIKQDILVVNSK